MAHVDVPWLTVGSVLEVAGLGVSSFQDPGSVLQDNITIVILTNLLNPNPNPMPEPQPLNSKIKTLCIPGTQTPSRRILQETVQRYAES